MAKKPAGSRLKAGLSEASPHYHGHRERLRGRFREAVFFCAQRSWREIF
jgi:hypothetical protein